MWQGWKTIGRGWDCSLISGYINSEYFKGYLSKIAQSINSISKGFSLTSNYATKNKAAFGTKTKFRKKLDISNTISKQRDNADLQPLHKDSTRIKSIKDSPTTTMMGNKQKYLSHLEDTRLTHHNLKNK